MESLIFDAVALVLILGPAEPANLPTDPPTALYSAVKRVAAGLDLWAPDGAWGAFPSELRWCRSAARSLAHCPPSCDRGRWAWFQCEAELRFWADAVRHAEARGCWCGAEAAAGLEAWQALRWAQQSATVPDVRHALARLREAIGHADYNAGRMP